MGLHRKVEGSRFCEGELAQKLPRIRGPLAIHTSSKNHETSASLVASEFAVRLRTALVPHAASN